jgi:uncharacterized protein (TIGR02231 family)
MKLPLALLLIVSALSTTMAAAPLAADSHISAVTAYADRAVVTRLASLNVTATGIIEVAFERLPAGLLDQSVQVSGRGAARSTILDVTTHPIFVDANANDRVKALEEELRALNTQDRTLADRASVLNHQREYVLKIQTATTTPTKDAGLSVANADWTRALSYSEEQLTKIATEQRSVDSQREDLAARRAALEQQLNQLRGSGSRSFKVVTVRLVATSAGQLDLVLRYTVPGTSWSPSYDARVSSTDHSAQLGYFGLVRQGTGEDWKAVDLTLSTARPSLGGAAPSLNPWIVQQREYQPPQPIPMAARQMRLKGEVGIAGAADATVAQEAAFAEAQIANQATSASFHIQTPTTVPSDNSPQKVPVTSVALATAPEYSATPKHVAAAFLTTKVTNNSDFPLLAGSMNVFLDDTFVASSSLPSVMPGEKFDLALGADEGIAIKRKLNNRFTEDTGLVNKSKKITYDYTISVQNNKKTAEKIVVVDQVPVSRHEKIAVKVIAPTEREAKPDAEGIIKWTLSLNPGEKRDLPLKFSIEYPADFPIVGLE